MASPGGSRMQSLSPNYIRRGLYPPLPATLPASPIVWPPWGSGCTSQVWYHQQVRKEGNLIQVAPTPAPCLPPLRDAGMWTEGLLCWRWKGAGTPSGGGAAAAGNGAAVVPVCRCVCGLHGLTFISSEAVDASLVEQVSVFPPGILWEDYFIYEIILYYITMMPRPGERTG